MSRPYCTEEGKIQRLFDNLWVKEKNQLLFLIIGGCDRDIKFCFF